jgi:hypothetical protein
LSFLFGLDEGVFGMLALDSGGFQIVRFLQVLVCAQPGAVGQLPSQSNLFLQIIVLVVPGDLALDPECLLGLPSLFDPVCGLHLALKLGSCAKVAVVIAADSVYTGGEDCDLAFEGGGLATDYVQPWQISAH